MAFVVAERDAVLVDLFLSFGHSEVEILDEVSVGKQKLLTQGENSQVRLGYG